MQKKITYILYNIDKAPAFEWITDKINKQKFQLEFVLISNKTDTHIARFLANRNIRCYHIPYRSKKDIPLCIWKCYKILKANKTDVVHAHLFEGGIIGITAAFMARIPKRIYTRHNSTYHHQYHPRGVKIDKLINSLSTHIVAICNNVKDVLLNLENVPEQKIVLIRHGFDLQDFYNVSEERIKTLQNKYNIRNQRPIIGIVSRYISWKGIQYAVPAFKNILQKYPNALLILANTNGEYKDQVKLLLRDLPEQSFIEIPFESDNAALYKLFDVFVHVPVDKQVEAFGQIYVEALAAGTPSVVTLSGVAPEFIIHKTNALVVDFKDSSQIEHAILELLQNGELRSALQQNSRMNLDALFSLNLMIHKLEELYGI